MTRLNVYVPDSLASRAREAGINVSALTQAALTRALDAQATAAWLDSLPTPRRRVTHEAAMAALDAARDELGDA